MLLWPRFPSWFCYLIICSLLITLGCSTAPNLKMPKSLPPIVKEYKHITFRGNHPDMVQTGIYLDKGDMYSILATGSIDLGPRQGGSRNLVRPEEGRLFLKIGNHRIFHPLYNSNGSTVKAIYSGELYLGLRDGFVDDYGKPRNPEWYYNNTGAFSADIILWAKEDWAQIAHFFDEMKEKDPENKAILDAFYEAKKRKENLLASHKFAKDPIVKEYRHLSIYPGTTSMDTGIYLISIPF